MTANRLWRLVWMAGTAVITSPGNVQALQRVVRQHPNEHALTYLDSLNVVGRQILLPSLMGWAHVSALRLLALPGSVWVRPCPPALALPHCSPCAHVAARTCLRL
jgi:hypothetical protein